MELELCGVWRAGENAHAHDLSGMPRMGGQMVIVRKGAQMVIRELEPMDFIHTPRPRRNFARRVYCLGKQSGRYTSRALRGTTSATGGASLAAMLSHFFLTISVNCCLNNWTTSNLNCLNC